jgi:hypothetical protein
MTTRLIRALLALLALLSAVLVSSVITTAGPASAAEYCVYTTPTYYHDQPITPAGEYCVPGP